MQLTFRRSDSGTTGFPRFMMMLLATVAFALPCVAALAQADDAKPCEVKPAEKYQTIYLSNVTQQNDLTDILNDLRNMIPHAKLVADPPQKAISIHGTADDIQLAEKIVADLDRSRKTYRLVFTIAEADNGKRSGGQSFSLVATSGEKAVFKQGSKVPIVTGSFDSGSSAANTQVQYLDVGLSVEVTVDSFADGLRLNSKFEQSAMSEEKSGVGPQDPVVRQSVLNDTLTLVLGKPVVLGSIDIPGGTRRQEIEVVAELVK